ncbi:MAG: hypothetical protein AAF368_04215 [Planctomycetota bacterium]
MSESLVGPEEKPAQLAPECPTRRAREELPSCDQEHEAVVLRFLGLVDTPLALRNRAADGVEMSTDEALDMPRPSISCRIWNGTF